MYHHKDASPLQTIKNVKAILKSLGIKIMESEMKNLSDRLYSIRIGLPGTSLSVGVNGKGISPDLARASAYGELMERIQNQYLYPLSRYYSFDRELATDYGFYIAPDERYLNVSETRKNVPAGMESKDYFLSSFYGSKKIISIPYYSLRQKAVKYLPIDFSAISTNGMCAGNTPEEALVQGISEIFERYVNQEIYFKGVVPPTVPHAVIASVFPEQYELLQAIEASGPLKVIVKDCSLGRGFPVMGVIIFHKKWHTCYVKFGAHPVTAIALERAFTEAFQGRNVESFAQLPFEFKRSSAANLPGWLQMLRSGVSEYHPALFGSRYSYSVLAPDQLKKDFASNCESLSYMMRLFKALKWDLLVRDVSFFGFPSYHLIVPQSDASTSFYKAFYANFKVTVPLAAAGKKLSRHSQHQAREFAAQLDSTIQGKTFGEVTLLPWKMSGEFEVFNTVFPGIVYFRAGNLDKAYDYFLQLLQRSSPCGPHSSAVSIFKCSLHFIALKQVGYDMLESTGILWKFHDPAVINTVVHLFSLKGVFEKYAALPCPSCCACDCRKECYYPLIKTAHKKIKQKISTATIEQKSLARVLGTQRQN